MCALYHLVGVSPTVSLAAVALSPLVIVQSQTISCSWASLLVQSLVANTVFQLCYFSVQILYKQQRSTIQLVSLSWLIVTAPILSAGLLYTTVVHRLSVSALDLLLVICPVILVLFLAWKLYNPPFWLNFVKVLLLLVACTVPVQYQGAATLQCALLLPALVGTDFLLYMLNL